ncbi:MAG TPA: Yip1 family protein [Usitatibacter sp.]|nr:Yip1 family protein [Usitatibacter sp.]
MNLVDRAKKILLQPKAEWEVISAEPHTVQDLYTGYVMILAAIPAVASFIGFSLIGVSSFMGTYRWPITSGVTHMILQYVLNLGWVYVLALIIDALAPNFGGEKNFMQALKVSAFSPTAMWLAGIFSIIPVLGILGILGLYSLYLLYVGLPVLMKTPPEKAVSYTVVVIIIAIVLGLIVGALSALVVPGPMRGF